MKSLELTFEAPIKFNYTYTIDENEIDENSFEEHIANLLLNKKSQVADMIYQTVREDLAWNIDRAITLKNIKIKDHSKTEFDF